MMETLHRYPGAQPFRDDEFSRRTFFGREPASIALTDQILANRLVIVYAKSGLGKTSLLNAGVAPRLREANSLPLFVRVNDLKNGPLQAVFEGVKSEAERQQVEYVPGDTSSLWSFFKTVEFWRNDLLLTPVLILDQFEELFTLQSHEAREGFLAELGYLVRGVAPPSQPMSESPASEGPPTIRVVLSLREDFLGLLEEASDHIPEILDHRYRLAPLSYEMASKAITGPAAIETSGASTRAFKLELGVVDLILAYLTKSTVSSRAGGRTVEPFHLQLICQRIESIAAVKQQQSTGEIVITFQDLGGEAALAETLENFYTDAIRALPARYLRGAVRVLCEQYLISPEGRRLSVEERELLRQLKLPRETLGQLVERRLLRTDRRSDSTYYELSHDALVQPVLASRRVQALVVSWAAVLVGSLVGVAAAAFILLCLYTIIFGTSNTASGTAGLSIFAFLSLFVGAGGIAWFRSGLQRLRRYRRHTPSEAAEVLPTLQPLKYRVLGWTLLGIGACIMLVWGLVWFFGLVKYGTPILTGGVVPKWLNWMAADINSAWPVVHDHPFIEMMWWFVEHGIIVYFGYLIMRLGMRAMWPHKFRAGRGAAAVPGLGYLHPGILALTKGMIGCLGMIAAPLGFLTLRSCATNWHGDAPSWLTGMLISYRFTDSCQAFSQKPDWGAMSVAIFFVSLFFVSITWIRSAVLDARAALVPTQPALPQKKFHTVLVTAGVCVLVVGFSLLLWTQLRSNRNDIAGSGNRHQASDVAANIAPGGPWTLWTVGTQAKMLESTDSGVTWVTKNTSKVTFYAVAFPTRLSGWVVSGGGGIFHTNDGGETWDQQAKDITTEDLSEVMFVDPNTGWIAGGEGQILHTVDAGATWKAQTTGVDSYISFVLFLDKQIGWASGSDGTILHTTDGGNTWKRQSTPTVRALIGMAFPTANSGWAAGRRGTILHTDDGGSTWKVQASETRVDLMSVAFVTPQSGWAVGDDGTILHTENAGATWSVQNSGTNEELDEVKFATPQSGWAVGHKGVILHTDDGGNTWSQEKSGSDSDLMSVYVVKQYGVLGMQLENVTAGTGAQEHIVRPGSLIDAVVPGSPSEKAGLLKGDIIVALNGQPVKDTAQFVGEIFTTKPGTQVTIGFLRNGKERTANATVADGSQPFPSAKP